MHLIDYSHYESSCEIKEQKNKCAREHVVAMERTTKIIEEQRIWLAYFN